MNLRDLMNKLDTLAEADAPVNPWEPKQDTTKQDAWAKLSPEQQKWLGGADPTDPFILARMRSAVPDAPAAAPTRGLGTPGDQPAAQAAADANTAAGAKEKLEKLNALIAALKPAGGQSAAKTGTTTAKPAAKPQKVGQMPMRQQAAVAAGTDPNAVNPQGMAFGGGGLEESTSQLSSQLLESFGYTPQLDEYSLSQLGQDASDTARGAWQGATLGTGNNIAAGVKSAFGPSTYKDELSKQIAADKEAEERSPWLYGAGNVAGAMALPIPGGALANAAIKGTSKAANIGRAVASTGANLATQYAVTKGVNAANKATLGYDTAKYPSTPEAIKAFQQANGLTPDGIIGPKTNAVLAKQGLQPSTVQEQMSSLRARMAVIETEQQVDEAWYDSALSAAQKGIGNFSKGVATGMKNLSPAQALMAKNLAGTANKAGQKVGGAIKTVKANPGKTTGAALAAGGAAMALGGGAAASKPGTTVPGTPSTGGQSSSRTATTVPAAGANMEEINQLMSELSQYDIPEIQQGLDAARAALSAATGDKNIGSIRTPAQVQASADLNAAGL